MDYERVISQICIMSGLIGAPLFDSALTVTLKLVMRAAFGAS